MHNHDQGIEPGCRWCDLDLLMAELAGDVGVTNLDRYVRIEIDSLRDAAERRWEERTEAANA